MNCENCGAPITDDAKFCKYCGAKLPEPEQTIVNNTTYNRYDNSQNTTNINYVYSGPKEIKKHIISAAGVVLASIGGIIALAGYMAWLGGNFNFFVLALGLTMLLYGLVERYSTTHCVGCKKIIYKTAKLCPYCNSKNNNYGLLKTVLCFVISLILIFISGVIIGIN